VRREKCDDVDRAPFARDSEPTVRCAEGKDVTFRTAPSVVADDRLNTGAKTANERIAPGEGVESPCDEL
jgi:hypothetical protein